MKMSKVIVSFAGLAIGALCLYFAFRGVAATDEETGVSWHAIGDAIIATSWWGYAAWLVLFGTQLVMRTHRWRLQVRGLTGAMPSMRASLAINCVSNAAVFLLPFRLGEFVRPNMSAQRGIMSVSAGLAATLLERALDGIVTTGFFGVVLLLMHDRAVPPAVRVGGFTALAIFGGALVFSVVAFRWRAFTVGLAEKVLGVVHVGLAGKVAGIMRGFLEGLACFRRGSDLAGYLALTVGYWLLNGFSMFVLMRAMHIDADPIAAFFTLCFLVIGVMIPAPPGNVGNFHAFARAGLAVFAVAETASISYAILLHLLTVCSVVFYAALFLLSGDVSIAGVKQAASSSSSSGSTEPTAPAG
jgi:uncharacterized protein (TIRG00374 family)